MRAAVFDGPGRVVLSQVPIPEPGLGELLIRVTTAGVCGSDASEYRHGSIMTAGMEHGHPVTGQTLPVILGHEFAGTVVEAGPGVGRERVGQVISCGAGVSCGSCVNCLAGRTNLCRTYYTHGFHRDGGLAEYVVVPSSIALDVGKRGLTSDAAALGQPMSIAVHSVRRGRVCKGERVIVVGVGGIGAFLVHAAAALGAAVFAVDIARDRLQLAESLGAEATGLAGDGIALSTLVREAAWDADVLFEVSGRPESLIEGMDTLKPGARLVAVGIQKRPAELAIGGFTLRELELIGTNAHICATDLPTALDILAARASGWTDVAPSVRPLSELVSHALNPIADGNPLVVKSLFDPAADHARLARY
jgi:(R,R)-butanediol dehydrogenase/meso-butanediol dehydrogenase/diacetyl reductase